MKEDGSLNRFEKFFIDSFEHPVISAVGIASLALAGGLSIAAIVNHSFSEESRQNPQNAEVSRCIPDKGPMHSEGPR
jgi:hypothetical protein